MEHYSLYQATHSLLPNPTFQAVQAKQIALDTIKIHRQDLIKAPSVVLKMHSSIKSNLALMEAHRRVMKAAAEILSGNGVNQTLANYDLPPLNGDHSNAPAPSDHVLNVCKRLAEGKSQDKLSRIYAKEIDAFNRAAEGIEENMPVAEEIETSDLEWKEIYLASLINVCRKTGLLLADEETLKFMDGSSSAFEVFGSFSGIVADYLPVWAQKELGQAGSFNLFKSGVAQHLIDLDAAYRQKSSEAKQKLALQARSTKRRDLEFKAAQLLGGKA